MDDIEDYIKINPEKVKEIIEFLKELSKKPKKTKGDIITQEEALDLCITPVKKTAKKDDTDDYDKIKDFIKILNTKLKASEKEDKKKAKDNKPLTSKKNIKMKKEDLLKEVELKFPTLTKYKTFKKEQLLYLLELSDIKDAEQFVKTKKMKSPLKSSSGEKKTRF